MLNTLFVNACLLIALISVSYHIYQFNKGFFHRHMLLTRVLTGLSGGLVGVVLMVNSHRIADGLIIDFRNFAIALSVVAGGPISAIITGAIILAYRLFVTGIGPVTIVLLMNVILQILVYLFIREKETRFLQQWIWMLVLNTTISTISLYILLHREQDLYLLYINLAVGNVVLSAVIYYLMRYFRNFNTEINHLVAASTTDFLTGLNNVRGFDQAFNRAISWSSRKNEPLSFLMIDIDHFKKINDMYGHAAGDEILMQIAVLLTKICRPFDIVSRNGGEEFSLILHDCAGTQAQEVAERIRTAVARQDFQLNDKSQHMTVSIGCASYPESTTVAEELIGLSDKALYHAKQLGRNRVVLFSEMNPE